MQNQDSYRSMKHTMCSRIQTKEHSTIIIEKKSCLIKKKWVNKILSNIVLALIFLHTSQLIALRGMKIQKVDSMLFIVISLKR